MITTNFQKWGALVASLASILTLSSAAEAITFTSTGGGTIGRTSVNRVVTARTAQITTATPTLLDSLKSVTVKDLTLTTNAKRLSAILSLVDLADPDTDYGAVTLFSASGNSTSTSLGISSGNYTFYTEGAIGYATWPTTGSYQPGNYVSVDAFSVFNGVDLDGKTWQLELTNIQSGTSGTGSFTNFSVDAAVPFDSNAAPAGVVIVFGALMLRRKLQQRSAQKMSLELVNS
ncbi:MAG: hypothetical protein AN482_20330 [Anabaena sp. LE011-02]|jgi:hypothetical protein|nr:MAG: hypothetical protein AN482_20330 [Anabaena sp. LE011-02]